jgi:hypothetical protein
MEDPVRPDPAIRSTPAEPPTWHARWSRWPGTAHPLLLLAGPGRPYTGRGEHQVDAWYCAQALRLAPWDGAALQIPRLTAVTVHVDGAELQLRVARRPWLTPSTRACGPDDWWAAAHRGHTLLGVTFTGVHPAPPTFADFFVLLHNGSALIGDVPVLAQDDDQQQVAP